MNPIWLLMVRCLLKNHEPLGWYDRKTAALLAEESQEFPQTILSRCEPNHKQDLNYIAVIITESSPLRLVSVLTN